MTRRAAPAWAFIAAFAVQAAFLGWIIADRALLLTRGTEIRLAVVPVNPRDLFRGDYVVLSYPISRLDAGQVDGDDAFDEGDAVFVSLRKEDELWVASAMHHERPADAFGVNGIVQDVGTGTGSCGGSPCKRYSVDYELEKFFVPEGEGRRLERLRNDQKLQVDVAVGSGGRASLKRLILDGAPVFQETLF